MERSKVFVIAEAGSTWRFGDLNSQLSHAREAIQIAKSANAGCAKFQYCSGPRLMEQRRNVPEGSYNILAWPEKWIKYLATYCEEFEIEFMCTVFLPCDVAILNPYVKRWKVASLECGDNNLLRAMHKTGKPIIVSYGADSGETTKLLASKNLHCTAAYPASIDSLNLKVLKGSAYDGYSDHSCNTLTGAIAVACGAEIVEVHFKLFHTPIDNPDYGHSLSQPELRQYIANIRQTELMLGDGVKKVEKCEEWALQHKVRI